MVGLDPKNRLISTFILSLGKLPGVGPRRVQSVLVKHRDRILAADLLGEEFARGLDDPAINKGLAKEGVCWDDLEARADKILERALSEGISVLHPLMAEYPQRLLYNLRFPPLLYVKGDAACLNDPKSVAVVGSREPTEFGAQMGRRLAKVLADDGYLVVSGLALGSDTAGHLGALDAGRPTVAVLSTPVDAPVYPRQNQQLADRIVEGGGSLVSEYALGEPILQRQFASNLVARDEWQPGLADGLVVVETSAKGGTKHALRAARETKTPIAVFDYSSRQGVDFFSDPRFGGNVSSLNSGVAMPIFEPGTIDAFKERMEQYRATAYNIHWNEKPTGGGSDQQGGGRQSAGGQGASSQPGDDHFRVEQDGQLAFVFD